MAEEETSKKNKAKNTDQRDNRNNNNNKVVEVKARGKQEQAEAKNKRKRKDFFPFGNYRNYYGYRIGNDLEEDPRLRVLKKEWFQDKDCLDIGCNSGIFTIQIAKKLHCSSILGIDIDSSRIEDAHWHLRKSVRMDNSKKKSAKTSELEVAKRENDSDPNSALLIEEILENSSDCCPSRKRDLFDIVSFQQENFVKSQLPPGKHYDTILCLSVTKWIQLNWGDDGLIALFTKIWTLLRPGGILVLEPQPWKSYENNHRVSETTAMNYRNIKHRPVDFQEILLDKIGFRTVEDLTWGLSGSTAGFNRPIFAFCK
ncbi:Methyltransf_4 domain-containing protein/Bin3 domain-containing protein [Cephalotus follicularis]|uniref:RNA methyltransferase n=1 Tax=Cephalotus follicularis TaxID=3775 RepID=A0A1Q3DBT8_CEPFO|nr:Methyltransf_4 domain-containing protein/Bin3 domain-containing protein [Cephalotus follicularis]